MCEYEGSYEEIDTKWVKTRASHCCDGYDQTMPIGSLMLRQVGISDGEFSSGYGCQACIWLANEDRAGTPLHICWHDLIHLDTELSYPGEIHRYVRQCLEEGYEPILGVAELIESGFLNNEALV